jgi:hypothetical protein
LHLVRATQAVNREREALEEWDPAAVPPSESEAWRLQLMARDRSGELRRAREAARQAATLARTPQDAYEAALLRARLEGDAGDLDIEWGQAERLIALQPHNPLSRIALRRAVRGLRREAADPRATPEEIGRQPAAERQ